MIATVSEVRGQIVDIFSRIYAPGSTESCLEWATRTFDIPKEESPDRPGLFRCDDLPMVARLFQFINSPDEREFIIRKSAQKGFTLTCLIIIAYYAANAPRNVIYGMPAASDAADIARRLIRLLRHNALPVFSSDPDDVTKRVLRLLGCEVHFVGVAPAAYRGRPAGLGAMDELDAINREPSQPHPLDQLRSRVKDFEDSKLIAGGTPLAYEGVTQQNWLTGTREELRVPCPHCGHFQRMDFFRLRFDHCKNLAGDYDYDKVLAETYLECEHVGCSQPGRRILEEHKPRMLRAHKWVRTNLGKDEHKPFPGRVSVWDDGDMSSTRPQHAWGKLALLWIDAQSDPSKLRKFFNEVLGLPRREKATETKRDDILALCGTYRYGCMPVPPARSAIGRPALFMGIDNQDTLKKWVKVGFTQKGDRYLIDHGECLQREQLLIEADRPIFIGQEAPAPEVFEQGREQALATGRPWVDVMAEIHPGEWHVIEAGFYDEGFETNEVREFCLSTADASGVPRFFPVKGSATSHMGGSADIVVEKNNRFFVGTTPITVYHINDSDLKHELYTACIGDFERIRRGRSKHPRLWFPAYLEEEFTKELLTEKRGQMMRRGRMEWMWLPLKSSEKNDFADALKYTFALWHVVKRDYGWVDLTPVMDAVGKIIHVREGETAPTNPLVRGRDYLFNVGGDIDTGAFDEDHAPIGPQLRVQLVRYGVAEERDGRIYLNPKALPLEILLGETAGEAAEPSGAPAA
jgi:phage terminase large subunit GpA-like protein